MSFTDPWFPRAKPLDGEEAVHIGGPFDPPSCECGHHYTYHYVVDTTFEHMCIGVVDCGCREYRQIDWITDLCTMPKKITPLLLKNI